MAVSNSFSKNEFQTDAMEENLSDKLSYDYDSGFQSSLIETSLQSINSDPVTHYDSGFQSSLIETSLQSITSNPVTHSSNMSREAVIVSPAPSVNRDLGSQDSDVNRKVSDHSPSCVSTVHRKDKAGQPEYSDYVKFMSSDLKYDYYEILIICAPTDEKDAELFQNFLQRQGYRVKILEIESIQFEKVESAYKLAMFFFLYVTSEFCKCAKALYHSHTFLSETLQDASKRWSVVPVYTTSNREELKLDMLLRNLHPIRYYRPDKDANTIRKLMIEKAKELAEREQKLHFGRLTYFNENKSDLELKKSLSATKSLKENSKSILNKDLLEDNIAKRKMLEDTAVITPMIFTTPKETYTLDETFMKEKKTAVIKPMILTTPKDETFVKQNLLLTERKKDLNLGIHSQESKPDDLDIQIDSPASQNFKSQETASSNSTSSPNIDPTTQTEIPQQKHKIKKETHVHYHTNVTLENATNVVIGDKGRIVTTNNYEKDDEIKKTAAGHNPGFFYQRQNMTDYNPNTGKVFVGVFWDVQNCPVPRNKSAADIIKRIRENFILVDANNEEKCFYCITDVTQEHVKTLQAINNSGVDTLHISADKDNSSDFKIIQKMEDFSRDIGAARAKVILITSDVDFGIKLADLKKKRYHIILVHKENIKPELLHSVDENYIYEDLIKGLPDKHEILLENEPFLIVYGYQPLAREKAKNFKNILELFFSLWKGQIVNQRGTKFGIMKFDSFELAKSAKENTSGKDPFEENNKIIVCFLEEAPDDIRKSVDKILKQNQSKTRGGNQSGDRSHTPSNSVKICKTHVMG